VEFHRLDADHQAEPAVPLTTGKFGALAVQQP